MPEVPLDQGWICQSQIVVAPLSLSTHGLTFSYGAVVDVGEALFKLLHSSLKIQSVQLLLNRASMAKFKAHTNLVDST